MARGINPFQEEKARWSFGGGLRRDGPPGLTPAGELRVAVRNTNPRQIRRYAKPVENPLPGCPSAAVFVARRGPGDDANVKRPLVYRASGRPDSKTDAG
jgi:hypothetical protein